MKIAVTGHQSYGDRLGFYKKLDEIHQIRSISGIIVTHAVGACKYAREWCERRGVALTQMVHDRSMDCRGNIRRHNAVIVEEMRPDIVIMVGDAYSSRDIERRAKAAGIDVIEIRVR